MFTSGVLSFESTLNKLVDLPLPVGPVTKTIPFGSVKALLIVSSDLPQYPSFSSGKASLDSLSTRITTFSPSVIGNVLTRKANLRPPKRILMRPSCGTRLSSIFRLAKILTRLTSALAIFFGN